MLTIMLTFALVSSLTSNFLLCFCCSVNTLNYSPHINWNNGNNSKKEAHPISSAKNMHQKYLIIHLRIFNLLRYRKKNEIKNEYYSVNNIIFYENCKWRGWKKKSNQTNACYLCGFKKKMNNLLFNCMSYSICDNVKRRTHSIEKKTAVAAAALCFICDSNAFAHWSPSIISIHGIERAECRRLYIHESMLFFFLSSRSSLLHLFRSFHFTAFASIEWNHCEAQGKHL